MNKRSLGIPVVFLTAFAGVAQSLTPPVGKFPAVPPPEPDGGTLVAHAFDWFLPVDSDDAGGRYFQDERVLQNIAFRGTADEGAVYAELLSDWARFGWFGTRFALGSTVSAISNGAA